MNIKQILSRYRHRWDSVTPSLYIADYKKKTRISRVKALKKFTGLCVNTLPLHRTNEFLIAVCQQQFFLQHAWEMTTEPDLMTDGCLLMKSPWRTDFCFLSFLTENYSLLLAEAFQVFQRCNNLFVTSVINRKTEEANCSIPLMLRWMTERAVRTQYKR